MSDGLGSGDPSGEKPKDVEPTAPKAVKPKPSRKGQLNKYKLEGVDKLAAKIEQLAKQKTEQKVKEELEKPKQEKVAPKVLPTTNERHLTREQVVAWVGSGIMRDPLNNDRYLPYTIKADGQAGASAQIWLTDKMVGFIRAGVGPTVVHGKLLAGVETINVNNEYQRRGLGVVLAIAFYVRSAKENAGYVELATKDTSGDFWPNLGMHEKVPITIDAANSKVRGFKIRW
jgi:hypothetical protein